MNNNEEIPFHPAKTVFILSADPDDGDLICRLVKEGGYRTQRFDTLSSIESVLLSRPCIASIIDLDSIPVDNQTIRKLTLAFPFVRFLCISRKRFHPELKDAIRYHLYACLNKPIDPDELYFFLRCIPDNETESRGPP